VLQCSAAVQCCRTVPGPLQGSAGLASCRYQCCCVQGPGRRHDTHGAAALAAPWPCPACCRCLACASSTHSRAPCWASSTQPPCLLQVSGLRELKEETGYSGRVVGRTGQQYLSPGLTNENLVTIYVEVRGLLLGQGLRRCLLRGSRPSRCRVIGCHRHVACSGWAAVAGPRVHAVLRCCVLLLGPGRCMWCWTQQLYNVGHTRPGAAAGHVPAWPVSAPDGLAKPGHLSWAAGPVAASQVLCTCMLTHCCVSRTYAEGGW
jgi:hypothetical protein